MNALVIAGLGTTELLIIFGVILLLFGAAKLPELARGSGRALRIFKAETKGLMDGDDADSDKAQRADDVDPASRSLPGGATSAEQVEPTRRTDQA
jgi:sec-independent protein translocase protein TatA